MSARPRGGLERFLYPAVSMAERQLDATLEALRRGGVAADRKSEEPPRFLGMPTIYYPGTVEPSAAGEIILQVATDLVGIDFALVAGGTSRLSGRVVGLEGPPPAGSQLLAVDTLSKTSYGGAMNNDGTFAFSNLPPGEYAIRVRIVDPSTGRSATVGARQVASWGQTTVWVSGDVQDVAVWLRPPIRIRGSVRQAGEPVSSSLSHAPLQVELTRLPRGVTPPILSVVSSEGTFSLEGVDPGVYSLDVRGVSHDGMTWKLRTASAVGRDLLAPFEVTPESGDISDVVLQLSTRSSTLAGRVTTSEAQPVSEYYVIAFPTDTGMWVEGSRRLLLTRPDQDGRYVFKDIPEGEYHVAVLADRPGEWQSRAFLQSATLFSARTIVEHAHTTTLDLRLVR